MNKGKGISPLIAAVILIAATMSIAGILAWWTTGFVKTRLTEAESITGGAECFNADFQLRSGVYKDRKLYLILDNRKSVDLYLTNLFLIYSDKVDTKSLNETLKGNEIKTTTVPDVDDNFLTGELKTHCPDVSVFFAYDQVT